MNTTKTDWLKLKSVVSAIMLDAKRPQTCVDLFERASVKAVAEHHHDVSRMLSRLYRHGDNLVRMRAGAQYKHVTYAYLHKKHAAPVIVTGPDSMTPPVAPAIKIATPPDARQASLTLTPKKSQVRIKGNSNLDVRGNADGSVTIETDRLAITIEG